MMPVGRCGRTILGVVCCEESSKDFTSLPEAMLGAASEWTDATSALAGDVEVVDEGATPHRPKTQPPTTLPKPGFCVLLLLLLPLVVRRSAATLWRILRLLVDALESVAGRAA